ncbi:sodium/pantothenate symporter [Sediminispirochaeta smaragdinae]|uniref:Na+/solute symporter n=1 Tax=Sediminispirochaeta smaragdinae (strain DSM 11293 / JCM 15392 / SEBR 4228) TaxID=573413 RepID=E1R4M9_SEDSS|nr:sodium:solute symporter family protein [Sediminispirochaeta smaragdinae]ADK82117.1 Na+/solute symporter [Sediminispirochaeta smaragdinae DSM 11293]
MAEVTPTPGPFFLILGIYFVLMACIGWYASRKTKSLRDYFVLNGKAGVIISGIAYATTQYSMGTFLGTPGMLYKMGYAGMGITIPGVAFAMIIPTVLIGRRLVTLGHERGFLTLSDYLSDRYEDHRMSGLLGLMMLCFLIPMMGAQIIGAGVIVNVFTGLPAYVGVIGMGAIVIIYCMSGGMRGAMMTDVLQGSLMFITAIVAFILTLHQGGGLSHLNSSLNEMNSAYMSFPGANGTMTWTYYVSNILLWSFFTMGQPQLFTKFFAMKDHKTMFRAVLLGTGGMMVTALLVLWSGVNGISLVPNLKNSDYIIPIILQRGLNPVIASVVIAGIVAAGMSTIDGLLITTTSAATRDVYQKYINPKASDDQVMKLSKIVTLIVGVVVIIFGCLKPGSIFIINTFAFSGMAIFVVPILFGMYWKGATFPAAVSSVIAGVLTLICCTKIAAMKALIHGFHAVVPGVAVAALVMVLVSLSTKGKRPSEETLARHMLTKQGRA